VRREESPLFEPEGEEEGEEAWRRRRYVIEELWDVESDE